MASDRVRELFEQVESLSDSYATESSRLSDYIEAFEKRLIALKGKTCVQVEERGLRLGFGRWSDRWRLTVSGWPKDTTCEPEALPFSKVTSPNTVDVGIFGRAINAGLNIKLLKDASVDIKVRVVPMFEPLLAQMVHTYRKRKNDVREACGTMSAIAARLGLDEKEGK